MYYAPIKNIDLNQLKRIITYIIKIV